MSDTVQDGRAPRRRRATLVPETSPARGTSGRRAASVIAAVALFQTFLVLAVLNPRTFFSGDAGVKYLQAVNLVQARWRQLSIRTPAAQLDHDDRFPALAGSQFYRRSPDAPFYGTYAELFSVPVSLSLALLGTRGMYLVPILASVGAMLLAYRLSLRTAPHAAWLASLLVGACSPMLFYSVDLWEHTLAVLLSTAGVLLLVAGTAEPTRWRFAAAGLTLGAGIAVREELYGFVPASLVALAWVERRWRVPAAVAAGAAGLAALVPHWVLKWMETGRPARLAVLRLIQAVEPAAAGPPMWSAGALLVPLEVAWLLPIAAAVMMRCWLPRAAPRWRVALLVGLAVTTAAWASGDALLLGWQWLRPYALVQAFPVVLFLLFLPDAPSPARREVGQLLAMAAVYTAAVCIAAPFGVRTAPLGGAQWGPRFLMPLYPLLAVGIVCAFEQRAAWASAAWASRLLAGAFAVLALASVAVQVQGIRELRRAKSDYERLVAATEALDAQAVVATDLWWFPTATAAVLYERQTVLVDAARNGSLPELLTLLAAQGITSLTLVSQEGQLADRHAQALAQAGWMETGRQRVSIWLDVDLVSYRREAPG